MMLETARAMQALEANQGQADAGESDWMILCVVYWVMQQH